jgi:hypothetical protein
MKLKMAQDREEQTVEDLIRMASSGDLQMLVENTHPWPKQFKTPDDGFVQ